MDRILCTCDIFASEINTIIIMVTVRCLKISSVYFRRKYYHKYITFGPYKIMNYAVKSEL